MKALFRLLRPKQWAKNLLVFAAWIFVGQWYDLGLLASTALAFAAMCLVSSATYIANDVRDVEKDRLHPNKKNRPLASGQVPTSVAVVLSGVLAVAGLGIAWAISPTSGQIVLAYLGLQVAYNLKLKAMPVLDVFCIATGFIVRAVLGAAAIQVSLSGWFLLCTGALALMLGFAKRRNEYIIQHENDVEIRESLVHYSLQALDMLVVLFAGLAAMCYAVYSVESKAAQAHPSLILTAPFVVYGISRYVLLVFRANEGGEPADLLFGDRHIVAAVIGFIAAAAAVLSGLNLPFLDH
ncbi:MAG: decaprenyl-phosphate phosphoribosyltransferase [Fimbriimonadaceae bacterium]|nr:decaprenyl-phosphate phosphoribosyltransferase [Fimbriimonadaceae bacterium]QYK57282.1 MAG: decaprenyl-phosphate phosphoribosyltransferase [Fimbriimonadaceae bacterium]